MQEGLCLSETDVRSQLGFDSSEMELLLGYFPWEPWDLRPGESPWEAAVWELKDSHGNPFDTPVLERNMGMRVNPRHLAIEFDEALLKIDQTVLNINREVREMEGMDAFDSEQDARPQALEYLEALRSFIQREKAFIEDIEEITGFHIAVAAHVKISEGLTPCPLLLEP